MNRADETAAETAPMLDVLWIGTVEPLEFAAVPARLSEHARVRIAATPAAAAAYSESTPCDLIVVVRRLPGDFDDVAAAALRRRFPIAPIACVTGPWCDGERRSFVTPPSTTYSATSAADELALDLQRLARGACPRFAAPATAGDEERRLLAARPDDRGTAAVSTNVLIEAADAATRQWLADAARGAGAKVLDAGECSCAAPSTILLDVSTADDGVERTAMWRSRCPTARLAAIVSFARPRDVQRLRAAGADFVASKPLAPDFGLVLFGPAPTAPRVEPR